LSAGDHTIIAVYSGDSLYTTSSGMVTQHVNQKSITATFTANSKTYDGNNSATIATRTLVGVLVGDAANVTASGGTATFNTANVGTAKTVSSTLFILGGTAAGNYSLANVATTTADINKAHLTVTADNQSRLYGAANPTFTETITGYVNGENATTAGVT